MSELISERTSVPPRILITGPDPARSRNPELSRQKLALYVAAIARHGAEPLPISSAVPPDAWPELFARMDALFLTGGSDIDPALYGEQMAGSEEVDAERDRLELAAWRAAEERALPVLGVCRGLQAINVFAGGSLIQDVPEHAGTSYGDGAAEIHNLVIDPDSRLARSIAAAAPEGLAATDEGDSSIELLVNTFHHQAIDHSRLAPSLRAVGWASSSHGRLVEAAESRDGRWIVGVQCHPERTESTPSEFEGLFGAFVRAAREAAAEAIG